MLTDNAKLTDSLGGIRLLDDAALSETIRELVPRFADPKQLVGELVRRGWLTAFQAELLLAGRATELVIGQYVLLEKLGEGGMGAVYKARHRVLKAIRAIKVIRPDRLSNAQAVDRFYREVEAVAKLHHPNIILAHDANQEGAVHYFVMEYAPGADLGQLLQRCGPLAAADASAYIRQAALGLQHAHERGLVHRDIKPSNVLVTPDGQVKLLDLGLARVRVAENDVPTGVSLTQDGAVMGTPDYMAPEQAEDSHKVDIRADIYSLGCTFYHILTGSAPYPGGSVMEKLIKHRLEEPRPVEALRPDLPAELAAVLRKMMTKDRGSRYQTPAAVAAALEPFCSGTASPSLSQPPEIAGTLMADMFPPATNAGLASIPTPLPGNSMQPTETGRNWPPVAAPSRLDQGSTEKLRAPSRLGQGSTEKLPLDPTFVQLPEPSLLSSAPAPRKRSPFLMAIVLVAVAAGIGIGVKVVVPMLAPARPDPEGRRADLPPATDPQKDGGAKDGKEPAAIGKDGKEKAVEPKDGKAKPPEKGPLEKHTPVEPPAVKPTEAVAKELTGDKEDLALVRQRGPAVRTGGRPLTWQRRTELFALPASKGRKAAFSADGVRAVVSTPTDFVYVYTLRDSPQPTNTSLGDMTGTLTDGSSHVNAVMLSPDGGRVLLSTVARSDKPLDVNPITTKYNALINWELNGPTETMYGPRLDGTAGFLALAFAPDGKEVLAGGALPQIYRWKMGDRDPRMGKRYFKHGVGDAVNALAYSPDGRLALSAGADKVVCIYDTKKTDTTPVASLECGQTPVYCATFSADAKHVVAGGRDGKVCVCEIGEDPAAAAPKAVQVLTWHDKEKVTAVACSPAGRYFATGGEDGSICLGEFGKLEPLWREPPRGNGAPILALAFSQDGRQVLVADEVSLSEMPAVRDVTARARAEAAASDPDAPPAEGKGRTWR